MQGSHDYHPIEVMAYSVAIVSLMSLLEINSRESPVWWATFTLVCLGLLAINYRYRRLCAYTQRLESAAAELRKNPDVKEFYLGTAASGALKSYKEVKSYKRRKRWL